MPKPESPSLRAISRDANDQNEKRKIHVIVISESESEEEDTHYEPCSKWEYAEFQHPDILSHCYCYYHHYPCFASA